jgi:histidinol dehydrogenase
MAYLRPVQVIEYTKDALAAEAPYVRAFAEAEDLPAHADAVNVRRFSSR